MTMFIFLGPRERQKRRWGRTAGGGRQTAGETRTGRRRRADRGAAKVQRGTGRGAIGARPSLWAQTRAYVLRTMNSCCSCDCFVLPLS